jgi:SAM-dependent methyltransferase
MRVDLLKSTEAEKNAPGALLVAADVRRVALGRRFDVVSCFYDSLNYLLRKSDLLAAFRSARRHLAPGGVFIFDINTLEGMRQNWNHTVCVRGEGYTAVWEYSYDEDENLGQGRFEGFIREADTTLYRHYDETHYERGYEADEVEALLKKAGFARWTKLDGYGAGRANRKSEKLLFACGGS